MVFQATLVLVFVAVATAYPYGEPHLYNEPLPLQGVYPAEDGVHRAQPYAFKYSVKDKHGEHHREEAGDGAGVVKGSYGFTDDRGISREVAYIADKAGFRPEIKTNEHGTAPQDPAATKMDSSSHPYYGGAGAKDVFKSPVGLVEHAVPYANIPHAV
ncbi:cuticle protein 16.8 [Nephila pilipes]|uniref:Cuticle protein 16.8 n=1 Tax=Nephila pilipes TaxID=299642 RepID=A0A8X6N7W5_NEPPI|nr:cuticle protein 16.8 [Nephila pilipes]